MDPTQAADALRLAETQRRRLEAETRLPHWVWMGFFAYVVGLFALEDFAPRVAWWVILGLAAMLGVGRLWPSLRLRALALVGRRAQARRDLVPPKTRAVLLAMMVVAFVAAFLLVSAPAPAWAPEWAREHWLTVVGAGVACLLTPVAWGCDRIARKRLAGR